MIGKINWREPVSAITKSCAPGSPNSWGVGEDQMGAWSRTVVVTATGMPGQQLLINRQ